MVQKWKTSVTVGVILKDWGWFDTEWPGKSPYAVPINQKKKIQSSNPENLGLGISVISWFQMYQNFYISLELGYKQVPIGF